MNFVSGGKVNSFSDLPFLMVLLLLMVMWYYKLVTMDGSVV